MWGGWGGQGRGRPLYESNQGLLLENQNWTMKRDQSGRTWLRLNLTLKEMLPKQALPSLEASSYQKQLRASCSCLNWKMLKLNSVFSIEGSHLIFFPHISLETIRSNHYPSIYPLHMGFKVYLHRPHPGQELWANLLTPILMLPCSDVNIKVLNLTLDGLKIQCRMGSMQNVLSKKETRWPGDILAAKCRALYYYRSLLFNTVGKLTTSYFGQFCHI